MSRLRNQGGFTLVELVVVLAISSLVLAGVLAGSGTIQRRAELTSAVDALRLQIKGVQSQADQGISLRVNGQPGTSGDTFFGKLVEFYNSGAARAQQMRMWTVVETGDKSSLYECDKQDISLPEQLSFQNLTSGGANYNSGAVIFGADHHTYLAPQFSDPGPSGGCNQAPSGPPAVTLPLSCGPPTSQGNPSSTGICPTSPQPPTPPDSCAATNWTCGLYGQYYKSTDLTGGITSAFIDYQVGYNLDSAGLSSSYPQFKPTLVIRAANPSSGVSVEWSGQILLGDEPGDYPTVQNHTYCFDSDSGSTAVITYGGAKYMTNNFNPTGVGFESKACTTIPGAGLTPGWYPVDIKYSTNHSSAFARLYEHTASGSDVDVPDNFLRTCSSATACPTQVPVNPPKAFTNGLYGQYYSDLSFNNRIFATTDPLIGDGGSQFSFDSNNAPNGGAITNADTFSPKLTYRTAGTDSRDKSVKWTGQILVDTGGTQTYCVVADDQATLAIDGTTIPTSIVNAPVASGNEARYCGTTGSLTASWHNIEVDYKNFVGYSNVRLEQKNSNGKYKEVNHAHLQRPLDWNVNGSKGTCNPANNLCNYNGDYVPEGTNLGENSSSTSSDGTCSKSDNIGQLTYTAKNLTPDNTYSLDINYFNMDNKNISGGAVPVPSNYSYQVCVAVNGTVLNGGNPISLPISEPSLNPRTYTLTGLTVPSTGTAVITLDWLNDQYSPGYFFGIGGDANFAVSEMDLYRTLLSNGQLTQAHPNVLEQVSAASSTTRSQQVADGILNWLLPIAHAALPGCDPGSPTPCSVLWPKNFSDSYFGAPQTGSFNFQVNGQTGTGNIIINTADNSIERSISN